jgi:hypothetical protein
VRGQLRQPACAIEQRIMAVAMEMHERPGRHGMNSCAVASPASRIAGRAVRGKGGWGGHNS